MLQRSPRLIILEETDPEALKALLSALHFRLLQSPPSLGTCIKVISLTEKHDCKAALAPWIARWAQPSTDGLDDLSKLEIGQLAYVLYYSRAPQFPGFCTEVVRYLDPDFASEWAEDEVVTRGFEADGMIGRHLTSASFAC